LPSSAPPKPPTLGKIPDLSVIGLHADAALTRLRRRPETVRASTASPAAGIARPKSPITSGITPSLASTARKVGRLLVHASRRHAAAAINESLCKTVLITHGESGRSRVGGGGGFGGQPLDLELAGFNSRCPSASPVRRRCSPCRCCAT